MKMPSTPDIVLEPTIDVLDHSKYIPSDNGAFSADYDDLPSSLIKAVHLTNLASVVNSMGREDLEALITPNISATHDGRNVIIHGIHEYLHQI